MFSNLIPARTKSRGFATQVLIVLLCSFSVGCSAHRQTTAQVAVAEAQPVQAPAARKPVKSTNATQSGVDPALAAKLQAALVAATTGSDGKPTVPGVSAAVIVPNQGTWLGVTGYSEWEEPITSDMAFEIGSISKNFTSSYLLTFYDQCGKTPQGLCLDDPLTKYLPGYRTNLNVNNKQTVRQTLNMTSGLYDFTANSAYFEAMIANYAGFTTPQYIIDAWMKAPVFAAGSQYQYCNTNFVLAGIMIQSLEARFDITPLLHKKLFQPNQLHDTFVGGYEPITSMQADGWAPFIDNGTIQNMVNIPRRAVLTSSWTAGGFVSTAEDLAEWMDALYHQKTVLSADALEQMLTFVPVQLNQNTWWNGYGLGTMRQPMTIDGTNVELHGYGGNTDISTSYAFYLPEKGATIAFLINLYQANSQRLAISEALTKVLMENL